MAMIQVVIKTPEAIDHFPPALAKQLVGKIVATDADAALETHFVVPWANARVWLHGEDLERYEQSTPSFKEPGATIEMWKSECAEVPDLAEHFGTKRYLPFLRDFFRGKHVLCGERGVVLAIGDNEQELVADYRRAFPGDKSVLAVRDTRGVGITIHQPTVARPRRALR